MLCYQHTNIEFTFITHSFVSFDHFVTRMLKLVFCLCSIHHHYYYYSGQFFFFRTMKSKCSIKVWHFLAKIGHSSERSAHVNITPVRLKCTPPFGLSYHNYWSSGASLWWSFIRYNLLITTDELRRPSSDRMRMNDQKKK